MLNSGQSQAGIISQTPTYFAFTVTDPGRLTAEVAPTGGATRLSLLSSDGQILVQSDGQSPSNLHDLIDVHLTGSTAGTTYYLEVQGLGEATGTYNLQTTYTTATPPFQPLSVGMESWGHTFDLNNDGIPDLAVANFATQDVSVLLGCGDGTFAPETRYSVNGDPNDVVAVDLKGNGVLDLVTANIDGALTILPGNGDGTFGAPTQIALGGDASSLVAGDFNRDGHMDLAIADADVGMVAVLLGHGDGTFAAPSYYTVGSEPASIIAADFTHDGRLDLATANQNSNTVSVLLGNGDGTFQSARSFAVGQAPHSLIACDFNRDGRLDIATANATSNDVSVLLSNGAGTFAAATSLAAGAGTTGIVTGDFCGDGHLDLAATNQKDGTLSIFKGHGDGTFDPQTKFTVGSTPVFLVATDFNHDGRMDLAHGDSTGHVFLDLGRGNGTFQTLPPTASDAGTSAVTTADFTGDGYLDLATVDNSAGDVQVLLGQGDGTFQFGGRYAAGPNPTSITTGDLNHDGITDLVVTNFSDNTVAVLLGRGDGTFGSPTFFATGGHPKDVVTGDFNHDGYLDLAVAATGADSVSILLGHGDGTFSAPYGYDVDIAPIGLVAGDFNGDGILDLATANIVADDVSVLFGQGDGTFGNEVHLAAGVAPFAIVASDFNGDGRLDLATANIGDGNVSVFLGQGGGTFASQVTCTAGIAPSDLVAADFNRDGHLDLAATDVATGSCTVLLGKGDGTFQGSAPVGVGTSPEGLVTGDFNCDGLSDMATANFTSSDVSILLSHGDGTFQDAMQVAVAGGPAAIAGAAFTGSGFLDLVTANPTTGNIDVSLGNGDGTFRNPISVPLGGEPVAVITGDFNNDGRPDVAVANYLTNTASILLGVGNGTFEAPLSFTVGSHPDALAAGDFNGDGILDLAVANFGSGTVSILVGQGDGTFRASQQVAVGAGSVALAVGDLNSDGTLDLVVANNLSRSVSILEGDGQGAFRLAGTVALGTAPRSVVTGDFTGDGKLDIATADQASNAVSVLLGKGDGTFQAPVQYAVGLGPVALLTGYFNGDGHLDLATANNTSNDVTILAGRGDGTFGAPAPFVVGPYPNALLAGDVNGDGRLDIATANGLGQPVSLGVGMGNGTFAQPDLVSSPVHSTPLVVDFNGDGLPDVAVLRQDGAILVRFADPVALGLFEPPAIINPAPGEAAREISLVTFLGKTFLAALSACGDNLYIYAWSQEHGFARSVTISVPNGFANHMAIGDLNGDGDDAVVLTNPVSCQVLVYTEQDYFSGDPPQQIDVGPGSSNLALVDMDGDHRLDIVVTDQFTGDVRVLYNDPAAPFARQARFRAGTGLTSLVPLTQPSPPTGGEGWVRGGNTWEVHSLDAPTDLVAGQFGDHPGEDLIVVNKGADNIALLRNDGQGGFLNPESPPAFVTGNQPVAIVTGKFTADSYLDLAVLNKGCADVSIFLGDGHGRFTKGETIAAGNDPTGLTVADVNGDGKLDLLVSNAQGDVLTLPGNGDGTFRPYQRIDHHVGLAVANGNDPHPEFVFADQSLDRITVQYDESGQTWQQDRHEGVLSPNAVTLADLNGDDIPDVIAANGGGNDVLVYPGLGDGRFGPALRFYVGTDPIGITVADINGDGIPDLVVANKGSNDVSILFGQGQGATWTLRSGPRLQAGVGPVATVVRDTNGDGNPDILVANSGSNDVYLLQGIGRGFFDDKDPVIFQTGANPVQLFVGPFDNHPGLDLVTVNEGSNDLTFFSGFGLGRPVNSGGDDPVAALAGDFNHDGRSDLIVAHEDGHFTLFLGSSNGPQITRVLTHSGLINVSDIALGRVDSNSVEIFATVNDKTVAIPLTFVLDLTPVLFLGAIAPDTVSQQVSEFSSLSGSQLELVATLILGPGVSPEEAAEGDIGPGRFSLFPLGLTARVVPAVGVTESGEGEEEAEGTTAAGADGAAETVVRNALITGVSERPIQDYLNSPGNGRIPVIEVPFLSPLELFDAGGKVRFAPYWQKVIDEVSRWTAGTEDRPQVTPGSGDVEGLSDEPSADEEAHAVGGPVCVPTHPTLAARGEQPIGDNESAARGPREQVAQPSRRNLSPGRFLALAVGLAAPILVHDRPARLRREESNTPSRRE